MECKLVSVLEIRRRILRLWKNCLKEFFKITKILCGVQWFGTQVVPMKCSRVKSNFIIRNNENAIN